MVALLIWIIFGALVGWIASMLMGTNRQQGALANIVVGVVGSIVGGYIARLFGVHADVGFSLVSFAFAILGAMLLLGVVRLFSRQA